MGILVEGEFVGIAEGDKLGDNVTAKVGERVGSAVTGCDVLGSDGDGDGDGDRDGSEDGKLVSEEVGNFVGCGDEDGILSVGLHELSEEGVSKGMGVELNREFSMDGEGEG